jgi:hypothetical protein
VWEVSCSHGGESENDSVLAYRQFSVVEVERRFRSAYRLPRQGDDGGSVHFWNVGLLQGDHMALYPRRLSCSSGVFCQAKMAYSHEIL